MLFDSEVVKNTMAHLEEKHSLTTAQLICLHVLHSSNFDVNMLPGVCNFRI
jgi:hypothetical protein